MCSEAVWNAERIITEMKSHCDYQEQQFKFCRNLYPWKISLQLVEDLLSMGSWVMDTEPFLVGEIMKYL